MNTPPKNPKPNIQPSGQKPEQQVQAGTTYEKFIEVCDSYNIEVYELK